jgi:hypothetical protein
MKLIWSVTFVFAFARAGAAQEANGEKVLSDSSRQVADSPVTYFGPFRINGEKPEGFRNFDFFVLSYKEETDAERDDRDALVPDKQGVVAVRGQVETIKGNLLDFESVRLVEAGPVTVIRKRGLPERTVRERPVTLSFKTVEMKGFSYAFSGEYLDEPAEENSGYTYLRGVLSKFKNGKLVAEKKVAFARVAYEELTAEGQ